MAAQAFLTDFVQRLRRKVLGILPLVLGAALFAAVLGAAAYLLWPLIPEGYRGVFEHLQRGDWEAGREALVRIFDGLGGAKAYVFVGLQALQVLIAPIPGQLVGLLAGYLFGFWRGLFLTMAGLAAGSLAAMLIGRWLGDRVVRRLVPQAVLERFDRLAAQGGLWSFFMLYLLPALPDDALCFVAGLTRWPIVKLLLVSALGRLPGMAVLAYVGASAGGQVPGANVVLGVAAILAAALWLYSEEAEAFFYRLSSRLASRGHSGDGNGNKTK